MGIQVSKKEFDAEHLGVPELLCDMEALLNDVETADVIFLLGKKETRAYAHQIILRTRCKRFKDAKQGDICNVSLPDSTIIPPSTPGGPVTIKLPHITEEIFRTFILYVYLGKSTIEKDSVFEVFEVAKDFGMEHLCLLCEEIISEEFTPDSVCYFLANEVKSLQQISDTKFSECFMARCYLYICEHAEECMADESFLNLPKEAISTLISDYCLNCDEVSIFEAILKWGKYQAGVTEPPEQWTEEQRALIKQHLSGIIEQVKFMLIDNDYFASKVEPTGVVPMELVLEKYRLATLQLSSYKELKYDKFQPRLPTNCFPLSTLLNEDDHWLLNSWYGKTDQQWKLVFKASEHNFCAYKFHEICDGIAPLFVIAKSVGGTVSGGFTPVPWTKPKGLSAYIPSEKAFLFSLNNPNNRNKPTKFNIMKKSYALGYNPNCGPMFGAGADFLISNNCDKNDKSYSNIRHSYNGPEDNFDNLMESYNFRVEEYEVFTIKWDDYNCTS